ncbi:phosphonate ABC transporter ATP-binding protein [Bombilactobacillus bombi]|uniref:phosphonate ABC transporter ATP-binding protein n=1 Tax=Bombilactobacillus bombi TaxID=1303590 RepID=UPI0015E5DE03|nr:phosphonate ABC transporter ATP-binding protein [Bombilactobacillus bombi]MBA1393800.1 phosphonate ABC transporter ATP-binding protein [Lactobacillus sp. XV13L]MBA1434233.1 phosphonate ABC transporter ATP-binding protein [Bombilactobacillus bombi]
MTTSIISIQDVSKIYANGTIGLSHINLDIAAGEFVVIVGLSGAGKSTLLRTINRMHSISSGDILINGQSIRHYQGQKLRVLRRNIGMIFQNFNLVEHSTVQRNVLSGRIGYYSTWRSILNFFSKADKQKAVQALQRVNLAEKLYTRADQLSGGQQQRVAIARALMQNPQIILADEPIASLDPLTTTAVMNDLKRLNQELGITVLVNLHSVPIAQKFADRIVGLRAGKLVYDKPIEQVQADDFQQIYESTPASSEVRA